VAQKHVPWGAFVDRRSKPSYGYRAVHVIPSITGKPVEIQLRTQLQHLWAELSETLAFRFYVGLKYGEDVPELARLPSAFRILRRRLLGAIPPGTDPAQVLTALENPDFVRERILDQSAEVRKLLDDVRGAVIEVREGLIEASDSIRTVETRLPGRETARARKELEQQIQALISSIESLE
jgi:hypothetical protein